MRRNLGLLTVFWSVVSGVVLYVLLFFPLLSRLPRPLWGQPSLSFVVAVTVAGLSSAGIVTTAVWLFTKTRRTPE